MQYAKFRQRARKREAMDSTPIIITLISVGATLTVTVVGPRGAWAG